MSSRKVHLVGALVTWVIAFIVYYFVGGMYMEVSLQKNALWIMMAILLAILGGEMADFDLIWSRGFPHRNLVTHSIILPSLICIPMFFMNEDTMILLPLYSSFLLGYASHLILDLFGTKKWMGTACIRFYWLKGERHRTMNKHLSKLLLLTNGIILLGAAIATMFTYTLWLI